VADPRQRDRHPVLPEVRKRPALLIVAAAAFVALGLGERYAGEAYPRWLDRVGLAATRDWFPVPRRVAYLVIGVFDPVPLAVLVAVLAVTCLVVGRRRLAVLAVAGPVATGLLTTVLKPVIDRTKNGDLAYPSGHMGAAVASALVVALLLVGLVSMGRWLTIVVLVAVPAVVGVVVGFAMTVTNYHYLTDAIGGFCVAVAVVLSLAVLLDRGRPRRPAATRQLRVLRAGGNAGRPVCE
jgi:membrane-associated phospholipid phosphatase